MYCTVHKINSFGSGNSTRKRFDGNNFCFPVDHARSTCLVGNVNYVFRAKNLRSDSDPCKGNKSTSRDFRRSRSPMPGLPTLSLRSSEINKSRIKKRSTCGKCNVYSDTIDLY